MNKVLYIGKRLNGMKLSNCFLFNKRTLYWTGITAVWIGHFYEANVKAGKISVRPKDLGESGSDEKTLDDWRAQEALAIDEHARNRLGKKFNQHKKIKQIAEELKPILKGLKFSQRRCFVDLIINEVEREEMTAMSASINARINRIVRKKK